MSTAKELEFKPGDTAVWISAQRSTGRVIERGIPLDTPGAEVYLEAGKVLELNVPSEAGHVTRIKLIYSNHPDQQEDVGREITIHDIFHNYVDEADRRILTELRNAGLSIEITVNPEGGRSFKLVKNPQELPQAA